MNAYDPATRSITPDRSPATVAVDNLMRRALKVSNPADPAEVAKALQTRYPSEALAIKRERLGVPLAILREPQLQQVPADGMGPMRGEIRQAMDDLEMDLGALLADPQLKDVRPELRGWATSIRRAAADGLSAARYGLDPRERDRAYAARRVLGEYARLSRYTGAVTQCATAGYCRVAQSCDVIASLILVAIGDALAEAGVTRSSQILQTPAAELAARRDAAIHSLRNLIGSTQMAFDQGTWPRGLVSIRQLHERLEQAGAPDLRVILDEPSLSRMLDDLIDLASGSTSENLRALGSSALVTVRTLTRFVIIAQNVVQPASPPLAAFLAALRLFTQGFEGAAAGYRLPFLARPALLSYGLYGIGGADEPTKTLQKLAMSRNGFAEAIDCLCCSCDRDEAAALAVHGKVLFDIDRAIDLYTLGQDPQGVGEAEIRAAAFGVVVDAVLGLPPGVILPNITALLVELRASLDWTKFLPPLNPAEVLRVGQLMHEILCLQQSEETKWRDLVASMSTICRRDILFGRAGPPAEQGKIEEVMIVAMEILRVAVGQIVNPGGAFDFAPCPAPTVQIPANIETLLSRIADDIDDE